MNTPIEILREVTARLHEVEHQSPDGTALPYGSEGCDRRWCKYVRTVIEKHPLSRAVIYDAVDAERERQISLGYTRAHDIEHGGVDHLRHWAWDYLLASGEVVSGGDAKRILLVQTIALLVAAIELIDHPEDPA